MINDYLRNQENALELWMRGWFKCCRNQIMTRTLTLRTILFFLWQRFSSNHWNRISNANNVVDANVSPRKMNWILKINQVYRERTVLTHCCGDFDTVTRLRRTKSQFCPRWMWKSPFVQFKANQYKCLWLFYITSSVMFSYRFFYWFTMWVGHVSYIRTKKKWCSSMLCVNTVFTHRTHHRRCQPRMKFMWDEIL